ncbi:hypothetical protein, partial [Thiorhodococcus minor]
MTQLKVMIVKDSLITLKKVTKMIEGMRRQVVQDGRTGSRASAYKFSAQEDLSAVIIVPSGLAT